MVLSLTAFSFEAYAQSNDELLKEIREIKNSVKENTQAVKELNQLIKSGKFAVGGGGSAGPTEVSAESVGTMSQADKDALIKSLKWQTNDNITAFGDPRAKKGGVLKCVETSFPPTLRITGKNSNSSFNSTLSGLCYETLLDLDPISYDYAPNLAKRWAVADDKQTFFFEIDERAKWSDGKPVCSNDVIQTWKLYTDPDIEDPFSVDFYGKYECPVAVTDRIVMVKSKQLNWRAFMSIGCGTQILPGHILEKIDGKKYLEEYQFKMMEGSGPYTYESSKVNEEVVLVRRDDWWQKDFPKNKGYYNFDKLDFIFVTDENLKNEKFKKGELDWMMVNVAREWHQVFVPAKMTAIANGWMQRRKVYTHRPVGTSGIAFNLRKPPFDDIRVRKAFAHLYNREKMMDKLFFNEYEFLDSHSPNSPYDNPNNPKMRFDPDKAVELLEEAGWLQANRDSDGWLVKDGKRFELNLNLTDKGSERIYTIFQEDLKDVGIKLNLKLVTWATDIKEVGERNFLISSRAYTGLTFPNPESSLHSKFADKPDNNNIWGFKNARVDEICDKYPLMFDVNDRIAAIREIDGIICNEHLYALGWYAAHTRLLYWDKFGMPDYVLAKTSDDSSILSTWWYDPDKDKELTEAKKNGKKLPVGWYPEDKLEEVKKRIANGEIVEPGKENIKWWDEHYPRNGAEAVK